MTLLAAVAFAGRVGGEPNRPGWRWRTIETEHFAIHYPQPRRSDLPVAAADTALAVARAAERAWPQLALSSGAWPRSRIHIALRDDGDQLIGRAVPAWDLVTLSVHPGRDLSRARGRTDLTDLVVVHEVAHVMSHAPVSPVSRAASVGPEIGGVGWTSTHTAIGGALRFPGGPPSGWSEGRAEWLAEQAGVAWWGAERAMTLRIAALSGSFPTWGAWSLPPEADLWGIGEQRYQASYAFGRTNAAAFGGAGAAAGRAWTPTWNRPWRRALGEPGRRAWAALEADLAAEATTWLADLEIRGRVEGQPISADPRRPRDAEVVWSPRRSVDWTGEQRGGWTGAFPVAGGAGTWVPGGAGFVLVPGDGMIVAAPRRPHRPAPGDGFTRLVRIDLRCGDAPRCTAYLPGTERASDPAVSPDGQRLAWLRFRDGRHEVVIASIDASDARTLQAPRAPLSGLSFSPDGGALVTSAWQDGQQDLWKIAVDGAAPARLGSTAPNEDDAWWAADGSVLFVADVDGVTDVFRRTDAEVQRVTRVAGGAATPSLDPDGNLFFSAFDEFGWRARRLDTAAWIGTTEPAFDPLWTLTVPASPPPLLASTPYRTGRALRPASLIPVLRLEPAVAPAIGPVAPRGGAWLQVVDAVENVSMDALFLLGADLLAATSFTWRGWRPDLSVDFSHAGRLPGSSPRSLDRAQVTMDLPLYAGLSVDASALAFSQRDEERLAGQWGTLGLALEDRRIEAGIWGTAARTLTPWLRADGRLQAIGRLGHDDHRLTIGVEGSLTDRRVEDDNRLFLGGDHPAAWLTAQLQPSVDFPALRAYADTGDALAVARAGWQIPLATERAVRLGPVTGTDVLAFLGVDVGDTWALAESPLPIVGGVADVRWRADLAGSAWDGYARVAWTPDEDPRFILSFGSGW